MDIQINMKTYNQTNKQKDRKTDRHKSLERVCNIPLIFFLYIQEVFSIVSYYIKWAKNSWTYCDIERQKEELKI